MKLRHFFLPHTETHHKAHFLSTPALLGYILFFLLLQFSFHYLPTKTPSILGITANVDQQELIRLTNKEREQKGLSTLRENQLLNQAALKKGQNMFEEDYWSHYSPSGKDPWGFIQGSGYKFSYAGENLARSFYDSSEVVRAWMESPTHRDNILNNHYQEIGIAVLEGTLKGEKTILVVQEFGRPIEAIADAPKLSEPTKLADSETTAPVIETVPEKQPDVIPNQPITPPAQVAGQDIQIVPQFSVEPFSLMRTLGISILSFVFFLLIVDMYIMRRRGVVRMAARTVPHLALLGVGTSTLLNSSAGQILDGISVVIK